MLLRPLNRLPLLLIIMAVAALSASASAVAAEPPLATTDPVSAIGESAATLNGRVNPNGAAVVTCRFEFGTTTDYGATAPCQPASLGAGTNNVAVTALIESLEPGVTYHVRLVAASVNGASQGADRTFATTGTPVCPNFERRLEQGIQAVQLPQCMALEQVNPPRKFSQRAAAPMISADGSRIAFKSLAALEDTPGSISALYGDIYVAERTDGGWVTSPTSPPPSVTTGWSGGRDFARSFDPTLSCWAVFGSTADGSLYDLGVGQLARGCLGGSYQTVTPELAPLDSGSQVTQNVTFAELQAMSADRSRLFFATGSASARYLPDDPSISPSFDRNVYLAKADQGTPSLELMSRDQVGPDAGKAWGWSCGVRMGGVGGFGVGWRNQGAVSSDGRRAYFSTRPAQLEGQACNVANNLRIMQRTETGGLADISELIQSECDRLSPACKSETEVNGDDFFQAASVDGSKVYFTTNRQLADSDLDGTAASCSGFLGVSGCDLYLYDTARPSGERLVQVSAGIESASHPVIGEGANVYNGATAVSGDGSHVYFVAGGVLTPEPNPAGKAASEYLAAEPKLYAWSAGSGAIQFIGALSAEDSSQLWGVNGAFLSAAYPVPVTGQDGLGNEVGGDGHVLLFQSKAQLTSEDADGSRIDSYRFDSGSLPATLKCVSCRPGGPDSEPYDVSYRSVEFPDVPGTAFAEQERWVSEDGNSVMIRTSEGLVASDGDGEPDEYLWRDGKFTLLPGTTPPPGLLAFGERPAVLSHDGSQVAFAAYRPLLPSDVDTAPDVYVARVDGGFVNPPPNPVCVGESCRPAPAPQPATPGPAASESSPSRGNVRSAQTSKCPKGKHKVMKNGKQQCVKNQSKKKSAGTKKRGNYNRGVQK